MQFKFLACLCLAFFLLLPHASAANFRFVDAVGDTGYYVDADDVAYENDAVCTATIEVIKADKDKLYQYRMKFDRQDKTYQILSAQISRYSNKKVLENQMRILDPRPFSTASPMNSIVDFLYQELPHPVLPSKPIAPPQPDDPALTETSSQSED